jgi:small subunit ribosomal protein S4e
MVKPGPHPKGFSIPLIVVLRDVLKYAETAKEARSMLNTGRVLVDKRVRKEPAFPVGLMDVLEITEVGKYWRVMVNKNGLFLKEIGKEEADVKLCRIMGKSVLKGGKIQLNLHDGRNILADGKGYRVDDSVVIHLPDQKIVKHFSFKEGQEALIIRGKNMGKMGRIKGFRKRENMLEKCAVFVECEGKSIKTVKGYVMVGSVKPVKRKAESVKKERKKSKKTGAGAK